MGPGIEVWDLDVLDAVEPAAELGGETLEAAPPRGEGDDDDGDDDDDADGREGNAGRGKKKKKRRAGRRAAGSAPRRRLREGSHRDAVLCLAWNPSFRNVLASGSADATVKIWDVAGTRCERTLAHHEGKVQALAWNPAEPTVLLTGGFDKARRYVFTPPIWQRALLAVMNFQSRNPYYSDNSAS